MNIPITKLKNKRSPSNQNTASSPTSQYSLELEGWAVVLSLWITFGLSTIFNSFAFKDSLDEFDIIHLPQTIRGAIWLVIGIWGAGYLAGFIVGLIYHDFRTKGIVMRSVAIGYTIAIGLRLLFINVFPNTPTTGFGVIHDLFNLQPLPVYYTFLLLTLIAGPILTALASFTVLLLAQERAFFTDVSRIRINPKAALFSALLPITVIIFILGVINIVEIDTARDVQELARFNQVPTEPIVILYFNTLTNPSVNMILGAFVGILVGLSYIANSRSSAALSAGVGLMFHVFLVIILEEIFSTYAPTQAQSPQFAYTDNLNLLTTNIAFFIFLWIGPIITAMLSAFAIHNLRQAYSSYR